MVKTQSEQDIRANQHQLTWSNYKCLCLLSVTAAAAAIECWFTQTRRPSGCTYNPEIQWPSYYLPEQ